ncbi:hypothetical protein MED92_13216 [Oceanospirillum sp. MED92]|uniref:Probable membrane transporter protein n=1 Tax=Neptuniibacter caesariensis TaxID=207954 RepID=A0A7U8GSP6_NEPCE|nr:hypothetical protein MED92_13216 [Oceanospirillum sp. MED92] [Neptuniibacter caesariensis]
MNANLTTGRTVITQNIEYAIPLIFCASVIRAYTGFGFAAFAIIGLNLLWPPQVSVPVILLIDLICGCWLIPQAIQHADRSLLKQLASGAIIGAPLGLLVLIWMPELWIKVATSVLVLYMSINLALQHSKDLRILSPVKNIIMGTVSGAITAAASVGGPPLVAYLTGCSLRPQQQRSVLIIFFAISTIFSLLLMGFTGLISTQVLYAVVLLILPALAGAYLGNRLFHFRQPKSFRPLVTPMLALLALVSLILNLNLFDFDSFDLVQMDAHLAILS